MRTRYCLTVIVILLLAPAEFAQPITNSFPPGMVWDLFTNKSALTDEMSSLVDQRAKAVQVVESERTNEVDW